MRPTKVITVNPKDGQDLSVVGDNYRLLITGKETENEFAVVDMLIPPGGGPGPHAHATFQESFYVIEGEIVVRSETQIYTAKAGAFVSIPKGGAIHSFKNESSATSHILCIIVAAGLEEFFKEVGEPVAYGEFLPPPVMDEAAGKKLESIAKKYDQEIYPPDFFYKMK
ncbi:cupin domain-containing protein [Dyadobacter arcticus]|uniref:Quercetin dioxygenase-like cupin family protein n=1 Tax=Dyadobacter arcticus TaxID=1078754 RepID=A0ABX0US03_9BACT|nr:cupin domain-containing protein [Dyadobacter arcticus]NIJ55198.1 quercetin dioxygenase-like cupin family protein [Dyadobacter arcticus]